MKWIFLITAVLILARPGSAEVASGAPARTDIRVRIFAPAVMKKRFEGTLVALWADSLALKVLGQRDSLMVSRAAILKLETYRGLKGNVGRDAALGFLGGGLVGILLVALDGRGNRGEPELRDVYPTAFGLFGAGGAVLGAVMGTMDRTPKWETIPVEQLRLGVSPQRRGGLMLSASLAF